MASKRRPNKRRKKKRSQSRVWTPPKDLTVPLWGLFAFVVVVSLLFSPATAIKTLRVVGAPDFERERMGQVAKAIGGRPYMTVNRKQIESMAMEHLAVRSARYRANLFGRAVLEMEYHSPVAKFERLEGVFLSRSGAVFPWPLPVATSLAVEPPYLPGTRNLSVFGSWQSGTAAAMCENIRERLPKTEWKLVVSQTGFVSLVPSEGARIEFGTIENALEKVQTLERLLREDPDLLGKVSELNLSSTTPVYVP